MNKVRQFLGTITYLDPSSLKRLSDQILVLIETKLWAKILTSMLLGAFLGLFLSLSGPFAPFVIKHQSSIDSLMTWLVIPAQLFLKAIKMVIIPLIFSSIIRGLASTSNAEQMKKLGLNFSLFVFVNTILAALLGVFLTTSLKPGSGLNLKNTLSSTSSQLISNTSEKIFSFHPEMLLNLLPTNPFSSLVEGQMLDVVILSIVAGIALLSIEKEKANGAIESLGVLQEICMKIISWAMKLAPYAVFGMLAQVTASTGLKSIQNMAYYVVVCFLGFTLFILFYSGLVFLIKKVSPLQFLKILSSPLLLAFSTSSSAITMPLSMKVAEDELNINPSVARFLIPLGTTVNMAGSAIWNTTAVIFISQAYNVSLSSSQIVFIVGTSIASAIGSPGVPGVGIGILATILLKVGVPLEGVSLILGVDRVVDMGCTTVNVAGDLTASKLLSSKDPKV